jgi:hypothetical protein
MVKFWIYLQILTTPTRFTFGSWSASVYTCLAIPTAATTFSASVPRLAGALTTPAEPYIRSVYQIAKKYLGSTSCQVGGRQ